ncbi:phosphoenolpyruvate-protein phosphotransferase PtsI [Buchnera aphidicola (Formosaphis micheliae)]|uniref:phosphoenolpyruvate-protein phosphotransferase PtsI n=1 Tax=Buchnera aphidicola TaxID=9 RepID=UPI0031CCBC3E
MISGILASPGIAFGKVLLIKEEKIIINEQKISDKNIDQEIKKFLDGKEKTLTQLNNIKIKASESCEKEKEEIFNGYIMLIEDEEFIQEILFLIKHNLFSADAATHTVIDKHIKLLQQLKDEYLKNRAIDIKDIGFRLLKNILNIKIIDLNNVQHESIIVAKDLTPSETAQLNCKQVLGFITDLGSRISHTSIIARALEIPAIVGTNNITKKVKTNDYLILDAINNIIIINPSPQEINKIKTLQNTYIHQKNKLTKFKILPAITLDGHRIEIGANISNVQEINNAQNNGAESIGLYRTEFLFMERDTLPSEEEQFQTYKKIAKKMNGKSIIIRTIDIGGDKNLPYMKFPKEDNPFLGWRAIRISIDRKDILHDQLKAILRASVFGNLKIMFPMIISLEEVQFLKSELETLKSILSEKKIDFNKNIEIGIMIETPAAAIISHYLIQEVDFFSIGSNDLTQYTLAVDRGNDLISNRYNPMSPSVLKLIKLVIDASHAEGKWTGICGELAGDSNATILLIGMGIDKLSMSSPYIPNIKKIIRQINFKQAKKIADKSLMQSTAKKLKEIINNYIHKNCYN